ncbi:MAG: 3-phosphoshikimate 1-carboxyvinyltransferase [Candidatus Susulua stagnicola]|nr:3-phosphoshikimate 1-carboxyvinyltransferase [Candidatus Susulua stagnicola]
MYRIKYLNNLTKGINVPPDKSISHRAAIISSLCKDKTIVKPFLHSEDSLATIECLEKLGVRIEKKDDCLIVNGTGMHFPITEKTDLYAQESGTTIRILSGILVAQKFPIEFKAAKSLSKRPMDRIIEPLSQMGAIIEGEKQSNSLFDAAPIVSPPLSISPSKEGIKGMEFNLKIASAQVKSAIILASLYADSQTIVHELYKSRDHTERMLKLFNANIEVDGKEIICQPTKELISPKELYVPSDFSSAAFFIVLALILENTEITIRNVNINPSRCGLLKVLKDMGANIKITNERDGYEPYADITAKSSYLRSSVVEPDEVPSMIDEIPILCVAASFATGKTLIQGINELRVKETNRINSISENLILAGVKADTSVDDEIMIEGTKEHKPAHFKAFDDHRSAMSAIILGAAIGNNCTIDDTKCINKSFPQFIPLFESL